jgi:hypothetical protein
MVRDLFVVLLLCAVPSPALAWGTSAHRFIMQRAIEVLPPDLKPFFEHFRDEVVVRVVDPDTWRTAGWEDDPNHFLDFGVREYGAYPFNELPREYGAAIEKYGMATLKRYGVLPWREQEEFGNLRRAFEGFARNSAFAPQDVVLFSAIASHYIQDAHQPLHASDNYDGQMTGQNGVHSRFETALFERYSSRLTIQPAAPAAMADVRDAAFEALLSSYQAVPELLKADKDAIGAKDTYDDEYFERFFTNVKPLLERRIAASITATASLIIGAWEKAGKPPVKIEMTPAVQRVRRPAP